MMKKPPKPTGLKIEKPPNLKAPGNPSFTYEPEKKKPTLDETNPVAASFLHIFCMTILGLVSAIIGIIYVFGTRSYRRYEDAGFWIIFGAIFGIAYFWKLVKKDV